MCLIKMNHLLLEANYWDWYKYIKESFLIEILLQKRKGDQFLIFSGLEFCIFFVITLNVWLFTCLSWRDFIFIFVFPTPSSLLVIQQLLRKYHKTVKLPKNVKNSCQAFKKLLLTSSAWSLLLSLLFCDSLKVNPFHVFNLKMKESLNSSFYQKGKFIISTQGAISLPPRHSERKMWISFKNNWDQHSTTFSIFFFLLILFLPFYAYLIFFFVFLKLAFSTTC